MDNKHIFNDYLLSIKSEEQRLKIKAIFIWIEENYPNLEPRIAWNQPMYTAHGTFIIGFSISKHHIAIAPEQKAINHFAKQIINSGFEYSLMLIKYPWNKETDYKLLKSIIDYNLLDKATCNTFWRK